MVDHLSSLNPMEKFFDFPQGSGGKRDEVTDMAVINSILNDFDGTRPNLAFETAEPVAPAPAPQLQLSMPEGTIDGFTGAEVIGDSGNSNLLDWDYHLLPQVMLTGWRPQQSNHILLSMLLGKGPILHVLSTQSCLMQTLSSGRRQDISSGNDTPPGSSSRKHSQLHDSYKEKNRSVALIACF